MHWACQQPAAALPGYLRLMDVGLVPYTPSPFNHASFPLKALEYLAAGRPVAATDLPALRALGTDLIHLTTPASFADQVDQLLTQPRTPHLAARCQAFAAQHTWARRAADIHHALTSPRTPRAATDHHRTQPAMKPASLPRDPDDHAQQQRNAPDWRAQPSPPDGAWRVGRATVAGPVIRQTQMPGLSALCNGLANNGLGSPSTQLSYSGCPGGLTHRDGKRSR